MLTMKVESPANGGGQGKWQVLRRRGCRGAGDVGAELCRLCGEVLVLGDQADNRILDRADGGTGRALTGAPGQLLGVVQVSDGLLDGRVFLWTAASSSPRRSTSGVTGSAAGAAAGAGAGDGAERHWLRRRRSARRPDPCSKPENQIWGPRR